MNASDKSPEKLASTALERNSWLAGKKDLLAMMQEKNNAKLLTGWRKKIIGSELKEFMKNL